MKNSVKKFGFIVLTAFYCLALGMLPTLNPRAEIHNYPASSDGPHFSELSAKQFWHTAQPETSIGNFINFPAPDLKNTPNSLWAFASAKELFLETAFAKHKSHSRDLPINVRKSHLIFPFHHFW